MAATNSFVNSSVKMPRMILVLTKLLAPDHCCNRLVLMFDICQVLATRTIFSGKIDVRADETSTYKSFCTVFIWVVTSLSTHCIGHIKTGSFMAEETSTYS